MIGALGLTATLLAVGSSPGEIRTLDDRVAGGYQVAVADVDGDGREDVITLGRSLRWLRSPAWDRFPINSDGMAANIDLAPADIDRDGDFDLAVASEFSMENRGTGGLVQWYEQTGDPAGPWIAHPIDREPTAHRLRWADLEGRGRKQLVVAPIMGPGTSGPSYDQSGARLVFYRVPDDPRSDPWEKHLIDDTLPVMHGLLVYDWDGDGRDELLTASREGIHLFRFDGGGASLKWEKVCLGAGDRGASPVGGSSEVAVGHARDGSRFIAAIEPWHGSQVVLYRPGRPGELWQRKVLEDGLTEGHALLVGDFDGDGADEIYAGFRGGRGGIIQFRQTGAEAGRWDRTVVDDGGVSCQGLGAVRLADGKAGLLGIGGQSHNLRLYLFPAE